MRQGIAIFAAAALVAASLPFVRDHDEVITDLLGKAKIVVTGGDATEETTSTVDPPPLTDIDLAYIDDRRDVVTAPAHGKRTAELTLDPVFQRAAESILRRGDIYEGAVVMTDVRTGKVLVWASFNRGRPRDVAREASNPAASVFKIVTASALVEAGVGLNEKFCYHGGERGIEQRHLEPDERRDKYCATLGMALGRSLNVVFARLADKHLNQEKLGGVAKRLGFGLDVPFDLPIEQSTVTLPEDSLEFARTSAGFWNSTLSPFQGANLAMTVANDGEMVRSWIVDKVVDEEEAVLYEAPRKREVFKRVLDEKTAWAVRRMMAQTVRHGTSFKTFHDRAGRPFLADIQVAGKTGTLARKNPETLITWWVGFAPVDKPEVAISTVVLNRGPWRIKGTHVASALLRTYFADTGRKGVRYPPGFRGKKRRKENLAKKKKASESAKPKKEAGHE
jgi:peptidoglycan glycosyltransferase